MLISILYQIIMILGDSIWLGGFKLEDEVFDVYDVDAKYLECRYDEDFIMYDRHEWWVEIVMRHVEFFC